MSRASPEMGDPLKDSNYCHFLDSPTHLPLPHHPAHTFLRDPSPPGAHSTRSPCPPPASSLTPWGWTEGCRDTALASFLHIPPAKELPPAFRSINNKPGTREKK